MTEDRRFYLRRVFYWYNKARGKVDQGRLNRALGILMSRSGVVRAQEEYGTTYDRCLCPDAQERLMLCKHRIAKIIATRVFEEWQEYVTIGDMLWVSV